VATGDHTGLLKLGLASTTTLIPLAQMTLNPNWLLFAPKLVFVTCTCGNHNAVGIPPAVVF
jgi:hypothetical protein